MASSRKKNVVVAKLAKQAKRYEDMVELMDKVVETVDEGEELSLEERNLLSEAYKKVIKGHRASWRVLSDVEKKEEKIWKSKKLSSIKVRKAKIEEDMANICHRILKLLDSRLLPCTNVADSNAYFLKMKGDYNRFLADFKSGTEREDHVENAINAYRAGREIAQAELATTSPTRLELASNFSLLYYETLKSPEKALDAARIGYHEAIDDVDRSDELYEDTAKILRRLRDNIRVWSYDLDSKHREDYYYDPTRD